MIVFKDFRNFWFHVKHIDEQSIYQYLIKNKSFLLRTKHLNYGPHKANIIQLLLIWLNFLVGQHRCL
jgi:hypothetical protein